MKAALLLLSALAAVIACSRGSGGDGHDDRFVVFGPSLVELMFISGLGDRIAGVDRYSQWPPEVRDLPKAGGYTDPSMEQVVSLSPTSIHAAGESAVLRDFAGKLDIPFYSYSFDDLEGVFAALDSLDARYGAQAAEYRLSLETTFDSLAREMERAAPLSVMVVVYHEQGGSSMTVAGQGSFFADILERIGCRISAPPEGAWPMISAEGAVSLAPDHVICLFPGRTDTVPVRLREESFWAGLEFQPDRIHCVFEPYMLIPGGRIGSTAERIASCLLSK